MAPVEIQWNARLGSVNMFSVGILALQTFLVVLQ